jgi:OOP family OmpA-OmpF porin
MLQRGAVAESKAQSRKCQFARVSDFLDHSDEILLTGQREITNQQAPGGAPAARYSGRRQWTQSTHHDPAGQPYDSENPERTRMKHSIKLVTVIAAAAIMSACATGTPGAAKGYVTSSDTSIVKNPFGLCWRTGYWTTALATDECDKEAMPAPAKAPEPAPAPAPAPAPVAAPAPAPVVAPPVAASAGPKSEKVTFSADAFFDFDKDVLKPEGQAKLTELVNKLAGVNLEVIIAVGHTDSKGGDEYNKKLSVRRADSVKNFLVGKGIEPNRVYTEGKGKTQPVADNSTDAGRAKNRRVEIEVVGTRMLSN